MSLGGAITVHRAAKWHKDIGEVLVGAAVANVSFFVCYRHHTETTCLARRPVAGHCCYRSQLCVP
jgi:hypothetical protein